MEPYDEIRNWINGEYCPLWWRIGSGNKVVIDEDPWLSKYEHVVPSRVTEEVKRKIGFFIDPVIHAWKEERV